MKYNYNTNQIGETKEGAYKVGLEKKAFDPTRILTPDAVVNFAFAQTKGQEIGRASCRERVYIGV